MGDNEDRNSESLSVSFIVAVKNKASTIERCLKSILTNNSEVVVVDGHSVDGTTSIIDKYQAKHLFDKDTGPASARNTGLDSATSDYVVILDGDQWVPEGFVKALLEIVSHERYDVVFCRENWTGSSGWANANREIWLEYANLLPSWKYGGPRIYRRDFLLKLGGWDESFFAFEDWDLWNRSIKSNPNQFHSGLFVFSDGDALSPLVDLRRGNWYGSSMKHYLRQYPREWRKLLGIAPLGWITGLIFSLRILSRTKNVDAAARVMVLRVARSIGMLIGILKSR